jgi:dipeptidyl aminopeptidase/acylaminoacyl peptidase
LWADAFSSPRWSSDGQAIVLPGTYLKSKENAPSRPCVAVVDLASNTATCVEILKGKTETGTEEGFHHIEEARFLGGDKQRVLVRFHSHDDFFLIGATDYRRSAKGAWQVVRQREDIPDVAFNGLQVTVKQAFNEPPLLVATYNHTSRVILDPNPQLKNIELGRADIYIWKDKQGRQWKGGLFKPQNYKLGERYPLVIQTHGFSESKFIPSGAFPTAFAARELAAAGILVLQVSEGVCPIATSEEGPCTVAGYEAAANRLVSQGLVDPAKIGIIGFSRSCFYVMETLTTASIHFKAASITDGVMYTYLQYLASGAPGTDFASESDSMMGAQPFGVGLQAWLKRSPGFNLDKVNAPLLVVGEGRSSVLGMWEPYAGLRYLHNPVDLIVLNTHEHVLTNPAVRIASQGGSVDWFRFWLQGYEDPDPAKAEQYARWHEFRKLQQDNDEKRAVIQDR